jgi:hypothetical protein
VANSIAAIVPTLRASPRGHPKIALVVTNRSWEADIEARRIAEVDIADFCCKRRANICSSTGCFASMRMSALPEICADTTRSANAKP